MRMAELIVCHELMSRGAPSSGHDEPPALNDEMLKGVTMSAEPYLRLGMPQKSRHEFFSHEHVVAHIHRVGERRMMSAHHNAAR